METCDYGYACDDPECIRTKIHPIGEISDNGSEIGS